MPLTDTPPSPGPCPAGNPTQRWVPNPAQGPDDPMLALNRRLDGVMPPKGVSEPLLNEWLADLERCGVPETRSYWLILSRLMELTLICAGHHAGNGAYTLAGDLLFNPRKIHIYRRGVSAPVVKRRHGRVTDQLGATHLGPRERIRDAAMNCLVHAVSPALIPCLRERLASSGRIFYVRVGTTLWPPPARKERIYR